MALLLYLRLLNGLPDPRGSPSSEVLSALIAEANCRIQEAIQGEKNELS